MIMKKREGFSLMVALFVIVMLSLTASYIFYASSTIAKVGSFQYQKEQAKLYARSYTEYAVLAISSYDRTAGGGSCLEEINKDIGSPAEGRGFEVNVKISYIGNSKYIPASLPSSCKVIDSTMQDDALMAVIDVYVKYKDSQHMSVANSPWITYHRRSLQSL